jgi:hypothetical protein
MTGPLRLHHHLPPQALKMIARLQPGLDGYDLPVTIAGTSLLQVYAETMIEGETIFEADPAGAAAQELRDIWVEFRR